MKTKPSPIERFREDLRNAIQARDETQSDVERASGVSQGMISNFLNGKRGLSGASVLKLWPYVYGCEFPSSPAAAPEEASHG